MPKEKMVRPAGKMPTKASNSSNGTPRTKKVSTGKPTSKKPRNQY